MPDRDVERLVALETALAHVERQVEELSDIVRAQGDTIDALLTRTRVLATRLAAAEVALPGDDSEPDQRPPHW